MSEQGPGEYESKPMSAIKRYYNDVERHVDDDRDVVMAVSRLLDELPFNSKLTLDAIAQGDNLQLPFNDEYSIEPRIAKEKMLLIPLEYIGKEVEESALSTDDVYDWYDETIKEVVRITSELHGRECINKYQYTKHQMCDHSTICPRRYLEEYLKSDTEMPDFSKRLYQEDPERMRTITISKLKLGVEHDILTASKIVKRQELYELQFKGWMRSHTRYQATTDPA